MVLGFEELSDEALTDGVMMSGAAAELQISRGLRFSWSTDANREIRSLFLKYLRASSFVRIIPNPRFVLSRSLPLTKWTDSLVRVDVRGYVLMAARIEAIGHFSPTKAGKPFLEYEARSSAAGWKVEVGALTIGCWRPRMILSTSFEDVNCLPMHLAAETNGSAWGS